MSRPSIELLANRVGEVLGQRYEIRAVLGTGAQGAVYRAYDHRDGDEVAVKILHLTSMDSESRTRMFREAQALVALRGTGAVAVLDQCFAADGALCLITELLQGEDLEILCRRREAEGQFVPLSELPAIFDPVAATLDAAHEKHIIHRDLKPENIFLHREGSVATTRVLDFGFAKLTRLKKVTREGWVAGSPSYIAPESWRGEDIDSRADLYSLAAVIVRVLTGKPPFPGPQLIDFLRQHTTAPRPSLHGRRPELPPSADDWAEQALHVDASQRFFTARAVWRSLWGLLG